MTKIFTIIFSILFISNVFCQLKFNISNVCGYDDNPFLSTNSGSDFTNSTNLNLSYKILDNSELYAFYDGYMNIYTKNGNRLNHNHSSGFDYTFNYSKDTLLTRNLNFVAKFGFSKYKKEYEAYNSNFVIFDVSGEHDYSEVLSSKFGYSFALKNYSSNEVMNNFENQIYYQLAQFFQTKTGVFLETGLGVKTYENISQENSMRIEIRENSNPVLQKVVTTTKTYKSMTQLRAMMKISQTVFENTGLSCYYMRRQNLSDYKINLATSISVADIDLWDNPYSYNSNEMNLTLTHKFSDRLQGFFVNSYYYKNYNNMISDSSIANLDRIDKKYNFTASFVYSLGEFMLFNDCTLELRYSYIRNLSNISKYDYKNNVMLFGISVMF